MGQGRRRQSEVPTLTCFGGAPQYGDDPIGADVVPGQQQGFIDAAASGRQHGYQRRITWFCSRQQDGDLIGVQDCGLLDLGLRGRLRRAARALPVRSAVAIQSNHLTKS